MSTWAIYFRGYPTPSLLIEDVPVGEVVTSELLDAFHLLWPVSVESVGIEIKNFDRREFARAFACLSDAGMFRLNWKTLVAKSEKIRRTL